MPKWYLEITSVRTKTVVTTLEFPTRKEAKEKWERDGSHLFTHRILTEAQYNGGK